MKSIYITALIAICTFFGCDKGNPVLSLSEEKACIAITKAVSKFVAEDRETAVNRILACGDDLEKLIKILSEEDVKYLSVGKNEFDLRINYLIKSGRLRMSAKFVNNAVGVKSVVVTVYASPEVVSQYSSEPSFEREK